MVFELTTPYNSPLFLWVFRRKHDGDITVQHCTRRCNHVELLQPMLYFSSLQTLHILPSEVSCGLSHNPAARHRAAHNPATRWCAAGLCATLHTTKPNCTHPCSTPPSHRAVCSSVVCCGVLCRSAGSCRGHRESTLLYHNHMRLLHSPSLVAIGLSVGYETRPPIGWHHAFMIGWSKDRLRLPCDPLHYGFMWPVGIFRPQWQPLGQCKRTVKASTTTLFLLADLKTISVPLYEVAKKQGEGLRLPCSHVTASIPEPTYAWSLVNDINTNEKKPLVETSRLVIGVTGKQNVDFTNIV